MVTYCETKFIFNHVAEIYVIEQRSRAPEKCTRNGLMLCDAMANICLSFAKTMKLIVVLFISGDMLKNSPNGVGKSLIKSLNFHKILLFPSTEKTFPYHFNLVHPLLQCNNIMNHSTLFKNEWKYAYNF